MRQWVINGRRVNGLVRRVQQVTITIGAAAVTASATIKAVDLANTLLFHCGDVHDTNITTTDESIFATELRFASATSVACDRNSQDGSDTITVVGYVVEFWPGVIRSLQSGVASFGAGTNNVTIAAVSPTAFVMGPGWESNNFNWTDQQMQLTTPTNLQIVTVGGSKPWFVVDFN